MMEVRLAEGVILQAGSGITSRLEGEGSQPVAFQNVIGSSGAIRAAIHRSWQVSRHLHTPVLLHGETGTGKELFARGIHYLSANAAEPFVSINCAAIPEHLLESELFGHERGAFTGANSLKRGLFEFAGGGTVLLDEIAEMPLNLQPKLLRVLEEKRIRRVGGLKEIPVTCRIIAATNRDLGAMVSEGHFRADLYFRLGVYGVELPALRERDGDIEELAQHFLDLAVREHRAPVRKLSAEALDSLRSHHWPGNVRELKNAIDGALIFADSEWIRPEHLMVRRRRSVPTPMSEVGCSVAAVIVIPPGGLPMREAERQLLEATLKITGGNISRAARLLDVSRPTVMRLMKACGLQNRT